MNVILEKHLENALSEYTTGIHYETLVEAKNEYFALTGKINEEDIDYESRMNLFNDWYLLQFISRRGTRTVIKDYLIKNQIEDKICQSFLNINYSLYEYDGESFSKKSVFKDILHNQKITLNKGHPLPGILKKDIFVGRTLAYDGNHYLLSGLCLLPSEVKGILAKESKKVRKLKNPKKEAEFLLLVESYKTKLLRYGHIEPSKIFKFSK